MSHSLSFPQVVSGNLWFDKLTMTGNVTLSLSKGGCPITNFGHDKIQNGHYAVFLPPIY
jgi:hypothetical protein